MRSSRLKTKETEVIGDTHTHTHRHLRAAFVCLKTGLWRRHYACPEGKTKAKSEMQLKAKAHLAPSGERGSFSHVEL